LSAGTLRATLRPSAFQIEASSIALLPARFQRTSFGSYALFSLVLALIAVTVFAFATLAAVQTADVDTCRALIADVRTNSPSLTTPSVSPNHQAVLLGKLDTATAQLDLGKPENALRALILLQEKFSSLATPGKLSPAGGELLLNVDDVTARVNDAISYVQRLID
jgi:hypothetical protein